MCIRDSSSRRLLFGFRAVIGISRLDSLTSGLAGAKGNTGIHSAKVVSGNIETSNACTQ